MRAEIVERIDATTAEIRKCEAAIALARGPSRPIDPAVDAVAREVLTAPQGAKVIDRRSANGIYEVDGLNLSHDAILAVLNHRTYLLPRKVVQRIGAKTARQKSRVYNVLQTLADRGDLERVRAAKGVGASGHFRYRIAVGVAS